MLFGEHQNHHGSFIKTGMPKSQEILSHSSGPGLQGACF